MAEIHGQQIVKNGLVLHLDAANPQSFDGNGNIWRDLSGNGYIGTLVNNPTYNNTNKGSIVFNGVNNYVANSTYKPIVEGSMTYEIIFMANIDSGHGPLGTTDIAGTGPYFYLDYGGGTIKTYHVASVPQYFSVQALSTGIICHFVCTRNGLIERNYINAIESLGRLLSVGYGVNGGFGGLGAYALLSWYFNCNIYIVRIYNRPLTPSEVLQNFNAQKARFGL